MGGFIGSGRPVVFSRVEQILFSFFFNYYYGKRGNILFYTTTIILFTIHNGLAELPLRG